MLIEVLIGALSLTGLAPTVAITPAAVRVELRQGSTVIASRVIQTTSSAVTHDLALSNAEVAAITDWSVLRFAFTAGLSGSANQIDITWAELQTPASGTMVAVPAGSLTCTGLAPSLAHVFPMPAGAITLTGLSGSLLPAVFPGIGSITISGLAPVLDRGIGIPEGSVTISGQAPVLTGLTIQLRQSTTLIAERVMHPGTSGFSTETFDLTSGERALITDWSTLRFYFIAQGRQLDVSWAELQTPGTAGATIGPLLGAITLSGTLPVLVVGGGGAPSIAIPVGSITLSGQFVGEVFKGPDAGTITLSGLAPTRTVGTNTGLSLQLGSLTVTGLSPSLAFGYDIPVASIALTGTAGAFAFTHPIPVGALDVTGRVLTITSAGAAAPEVGTIVLDGLAPSLVVTVAVPVPAGAVSLTGYDFANGYGAHPAAGTITFTGTTMLFGEGIGIQAGTLDLTGTVSAQDLGHAIPAGTITFTGHAVLQTGDKLIGIPLGAITLGPQTPIATATTDVALPLQVGELIVTGHALVSREGVIILLPVGSAPYIGQAPLAIRLIPIGIPLGSIAVTGLTMTVNPFVATPVEFFVVDHQDIFFDIDS